MKLSAFKASLTSLSSLHFSLPDGTEIPAHFHITEAGLSSKHFIDCGGTIRTEKNITFQIWVAEDTEHRLEPSKLLKIIQKSEILFGFEDLPIEFEYQQDTIGRFGLGFQDGQFLLTNKKTDCLAKDNCGIPAEKQKVNLADLNKSEAACCVPGGNCC